MSLYMASYESWAATMVQAIQQGKKGTQRYCEAIVHPCKLPFQDGTWMHTGCKSDGQSSKYRRHSALFLECLCSSERIVMTESAVKRCVSRVSSCVHACALKGNER
jgi:hypothetical protein